MRKLSFEESLRKYEVDEEIINKIMSVPYDKDENRRQNQANFMCAVLKKSEELLDNDVLIKVRSESPCAITGKTLENSKKFAKDNADKSLAEKIELLHMVSLATPQFTDEKYFEVVICNRMDVCPCPCLRGCKPKDDVMPLSYCYCCAGNIRFHYQKVLGAKIRIVKMVSTITSSNGTKPCIAVFEIVK